MQPQPLLSIGMIVKNEMRCLKRCLDALTPLREAIPCQLVIADTGSTDGTRELAAQYADILFDYEWCSDFAAARNAVLDRCTGLWHIQVDADEYLDPEFSELTDFLRSPDANRFDQGILRMLNYGPEKMEVEDCTEFRPRRLLRIASGSRFEGPIHESTPLKEGHTVVYLHNLLLHHDGYAGKNNRGKPQRNMAILEAQLKKEPNSLYRIVQCLESSASLENRRKYAPMAVEAAEKIWATDTENFWCIVAFNSAVALCADHLLPEVPAWASRAKELFPHSIFVGVGISFTYARYLASMGDHAGACRELKAYFTALERYDKGDFDGREFQLSVCRGLSQKQRRQARMLHIYCLSKLKSWEELVTALEGFEFGKKPEEGDMLGCLNGIIELWKHGQPEAERLIARMHGKLEAVGQDDVMAAFLKLCRTAFKTPGEDAEPVPEGREEWELFLSLGEWVDLGVFSALMEAKNAQEAEGLLAKVQHFAALPPEALLAVLSLGAALPEGFFGIKAEDISSLAMGLAGLLKEEPARAMALCAVAQGAGPGLALFGFSYACELCGLVEWERGGSLALFEYFCDWAGQYLPQFFAPAMLAPENLHALPVLARFAQCCLQARDARTAGDEVGYVRALRAGLATCPGMKNMVSYLSESARAQLAKPITTPEMQALASQIRAILAQYPANDPAVQALKNSAEYKLVSHLIEG